MTYRVHVGGTLYRHFSTLEAARKYCPHAFARTGIVLSIVLARARPKERKGR